MASNSIFQAVDGAEWHAGFMNLLRKESRDWWATRFWLVQSIVWLTIMNGIVAAILIAGPRMVLSDPSVSAAARAQFLSTAHIAALEKFFALAAIALPIGVVILAQDEIIGERQSGTAEWILSKPVSRSALILAKLTGNLIGIACVMVLLQGALAYLQIAIYRGTALPIVAFTLGLGAVCLGLLFYLSLTLMLGTLFSSRGAVVGIPLAIMLGHMLKIIPGLDAIMPWSVTLPLATGQPIPSTLPIIVPAVCSVLCVGIAVWRFEREEF